MPVRAVVSDMRKMHVGRGSSFFISDLHFAESLFQTCSRACLKNHSRNLHAPLCGIFHPNSVAVARYGALIRAKSPTNCDAHLAESLFQTRSRACLLCTSITIPAKNVKTEINCDVESTPTLPLARSPRKNSTTNLPAL